MPWNGPAPNQQAGRTDGVRVGDDVYQQQAAAPVSVDATLFDVHDTDLKDMVNACLKKDGGNTATADLPMGGFKFTNVAEAAARNQYARFSQLQDNKGQYVGTVGGTADAITLTPSPAITAYVAGQRFTFIAGGNNTTATTVNVSGVGAKSVVRQDGSATALSAGDITEDTIVDIEYDGTNFLLLSLAKLPAALTATAGIASNSTGATEYAATRYEAAATGPRLALQLSRNASIGAHTVVESGDAMGKIIFRGSDGDSFENGAEISAIVDGTPGSTDMPGALVLSTSADGSATPTERMAIRANGKIQIPNRSAPTIEIDPSGFVDLDEISAPSAPGANIARLYALDDGAGTTRLQMKDSAGVVTTLVPGELIAIIEDQKAQNTVGQTLNTGSDQTRELNTLVFNRNTLVSLSSNRFTLPAGTWEIAWDAPFAPGSGGGRTHQSLLYNFTDSSEVARGMSCTVDQSVNNENGQQVSQGSTVVTITGSKAFEIRSRVGITSTTGNAANFGTEIYTRVTVRRA